MTEPWFPPDPETTSDLERLRETTQTLGQRLGLSVVPPGVAVLLVGAANALPSGRWNPWLIVAAVVVGIGSWLWIRNHYRRTVGTVARRPTRAELAIGVAAAALLVTGALLDAVLDAPASLMLVALALAFGIGLLPSGGHRAIFGAALLVASVIVGPLLWGPSTTGGLASMVMGAAFIAAGVATHAQLDQALAPVGSARR